MKFIFLLVSLPLVLGKSTPSSPTYKAGVVHYHKILDGNVQENFERNADEFVKIIASKEAEGLDIIVFPENALNLGAPVSFSEDQISSPCTDTNFGDGPIKKISCAALKHDMYVVVNVREQAKCPDREMIDNEDDRECASESNLYNTNIVFSRFGTIISKYRKYNLFNEPDVYKPKKPQTATFDTDFGVTFGHFICFDIVFGEPALTLVRDMNVTDIIYTTQWLNELYFGMGEFVQCI